MKPQTLDQRKIRALKSARTLLENGSEQFICYALEETAGRVPELSKACCELKCHIDYQLRPHFTLGGWITGKGHVSPTEKNSHPERMLTTRLAWIDWMIAAIKERK